MIAHATISSNNEECQARSSELCTRWSNMGRAARLELVIPLWRFHHTTQTWSINSNKAVTWHMKISSSRPAHLSKNISSKISDISPCDVHNFYGPTFCLRGYSFANETIWLPTNELAAMITRKTLSANLLFSRFHLASPSPRWEYIIVSAAIVCFSLSLSDK